MRKINLFLQVIVWTALVVMPLAAQKGISIVGSRSNLARPLYSEYLYSE